MTSMRVGCQSTAARRLALVDLDWDAVRAVDILVVMRSFLPRGAAIQRVTVYPSDYGLERMREEAEMGPRVSGAYIKRRSTLLGTGALTGVQGEWKTTAPTDTHARFRSIRLVGIVPRSHGLGCMDVQGA